MQPAVSASYMILKVLWASNISAWGEEKKKIEEADMKIA